MANNVIAQILGGEKQVLDNVATIADVKQRLQSPTYSATLNGDPASDADDVQEGDFVSLAQAVKGGIL